MTDTNPQRIGDVLLAARRHRRKRLGLACATGALVAALAATVALPSRPRLVWNASASAPVGLWRVMPDTSIRRGDMVIARLAEPWRGRAARRHYLPANVPLIKRVAAEPGDRVCAFEAWIFVEGRLATVRRQSDGSGRPMPWWQGCRTLRDGAMLLLMDDPASFDGRYFGPTRRGDIIGKAVPLWLR